MRFFHVDENESPSEPLEKSVDVFRESFVGVTLFCFQELWCLTDGWETKSTPSAERLEFAGINPGRSLVMLVKFVEFPLEVCVEKLWL